MGQYMELAQTMNALGAIAMILVGSRWLKKSLRAGACSWRGCCR